MISCSVNVDRLVLQLDALRDATQADNWEVLKEETRALSTTLVNFVPPLRANGEPRKVGENAVERDIKNLVGEASPEFLDDIGARYGIVDIDAWLTKDGGAKLNLKWDHLDPSGARLEEYHRSYRDRDGRIPKVKGQYGESKWKARVVAPPGARDQLIAAKKARVGRWKASWAFAAFELGASFPNWLSRHFGTLNELAVFDARYDAKSPTITFGSRAGGNFRIAKDLNQGFKVRINAIKKRLELMASGYAKDVAAGIRIARKANQVKAEEAHLEA